MNSEESRSRGNDRARGRRSSAFWVAPTILCLVSVVHIYQVRIHDRSPWFGGGFGMFSSLETVGSRLIQITLETPQGAIAVAPPEGPLDEVYNALRVHPSKGNLQRYAEGLLNLDWVVVSPEFESSSLENVALPIDEKSADSVSIDSTPRIRSGTLDEDSTPIDVHAVGLRVWQRRFDLETKHVYLESRLDLRLARDRP